MLARIAYANARDRRRQRFTKVLSASSGSRAFRAGVLTAEPDHPPTHPHTYIHLGRPDILMDTIVSLSCVALHRVALRKVRLLRLVSLTKLNATLESALHKTSDVTTERCIDMNQLDYHHFFLSLSPFFSLCVVHGIDN